MHSSIRRLIESELALPVVVGLLVFFAAAPGARAEHVFRLDAGVFNGKIQSTYQNSTYPYNASNGTYVGMEFEKGGPRWRWLIGGSYEGYSGLHYGSQADYSTASVLAANNFSDLKLGLVWASKWVEWRFIYSRFQTPLLWVYSYTDPNLHLPATVDMPFTATGDYFRLEAIMYATASAYRLQFHYYFAVPISPIQLPDTIDTPIGAQTVGGQATENYFLGGCARIFAGGDKFRIGPSICVDLQEMALPGQIVYRQEVSARLTTEF